MPSKREKKSREEEAKIEEKRRQLEKWRNAVKPSESAEQNREKLPDLPGWQGGCSWRAAKENMFTPPREWEWRGRGHWHGRHSTP